MERTVQIVCQVRTKALLNDDGSVKCTVSCLVPVPGSEEMAGVSIDVSPELSEKVRVVLQEVQDSMVEEAFQQAGAAAAMHATINRVRADQEQQTEQIPVEGEVTK